MKKYVLTLAIAFATISFCNAQKSFQFSIGPELGIATGDFGKTHSIGLGVNVTAEHMFDKNLSGTIASGVLIYSGKSVSNNLKFQSQTIIPIRAGARYYLGSSFYTAGELGLGILSGAVSTTAFGYSLGIGSKIKTGSRNLDVGVKYDAYSKTGTLGAVVFKVAFVL